MALGIERAMRRRFGAQVVAVERVEEGAAGAADPAAPPDAASIDSMLDSLRPAIAAYGGSVTVASVDAGGVCTLAWAGPAPISAGVVAAVRDRFPTLADVVLEMTEESE
jgi:Fe-S cluster biogenesis protein NfuA